MQIVTAVLTGVLVLLAGNLPWAGFGRIGGLAAQNFRVGVVAPWAIIPMALYLWAYWRFISGAWGGDTSAGARRAYLRANRLSARVWSASLGAGALGFVTLLVLLSLAARLVPLPTAAPITTPAAMPVVTAFLLLVMQSVVAGVTEEAAFRGYMQSMIERRHGVVIAILVNGVIFGLLHFGNHPRDVLLMVPYYIAVSAVYGGLTWAADSILPAVALHSAGDVIVLTRWWISGLPEWQLAETPPPLVWASGIDAPFVLTTLVAVALAALTTWMYWLLRTVRGRSVCITVTNTA